MSNTADDIAHGMHGAINGVAGAAIAAFAFSHADGARRNAETAAASQAARAGVLRSMVHGLRREGADLRAAHREEVLDLQADAAFFRSENIKLTERVKQLEAALIRTDCDCRTLATALREARAA